MQSKPTQCFSWRSILISSHLCLSLPSSLPHVSPPKPCTHLSSFPYISHSSSTCPSRYSRLDHLNNIWQWVPIMKFPHLLLHHIPQYIPQHQILEHPSPMFWNQCGQSSFTPIYDNTQNYCSAHFYIHVFKQQTGSLDWMLAGNLCIHSYLFHQWNIDLLRVILACSGSLSPRHGASSGCG